MVYTKEAETADQYIEKFAHENGKKYRITVATSDGLEQIIIRGAGCRLLSARDFEADVKRSEQAIREILKEVLQSDKPVLLDFWASWCGPCQMVSPVIEQIGEENDSIRVGKVNVDEQGELTMQFRVVSIPTLVVMKGGEEVNRIVGAASKSEILAML